MDDKLLIKKIIFLALCLSISACLQVFPDYFVYWRESLLTEVWRIWTAHWVHVGWIHYVLNMLAFICLPFIFPQFKLSHIAVLLCILPLCMSLSFYLFFPNIMAYAGLSGVLHGLYVVAAMMYLFDPKERRFSILVLVLISGKLLWENTFGQMGTAELIGSPVLVEAHLVGALSGLIYAILYILVVKFLKR
ncbi:MAG: rhombosortase [Acinetobacter sp.]|mgnify:CR=1 FL=1